MNWKSQFLRWSSTIITIIAIIGGVLAAPASAATVDVSCLGTDETDYSPGLLLTTHLVHGTEVDTFSPCSSTRPGLPSGTSSSDETLPLSCAVPLGTGSGLFTVNRNNGRNSTLDANFTVTATGSVVSSVVTGTVVSG